MYEEDRQYWAAIPIRLVLGINFMFAGSAKLFTAAGRDSFAQLLDSLGIGGASILAPILGAIEFLGGIGILIGLFTTTLSALNALFLLLVVILALASGRLPTPFPDTFGLPDYAVPQYGTSIMLIASLVTLYMGGAGRWSVDNWLTRYRLRNKVMTLIVKVKPGQAQALTDILTEVNSNLFDNKYIRFEQDQFTHFLRMLIINTPQHGGQRLVLAATYHGEMSTYVDQLVSIMPGIDDIFGKVEEYTGAANFHDFVNKTYIQSPYWFTAWPYESVQSLRNKIAIREEIERILDMEGVASYIDSPGLKPLIDRMIEASNPSTLVQLDRWLQKTQHNIIRTLQKTFVKIANRITEIYAKIGEPQKYPLIIDLVTDPEKRRKSLAHTMELENNVSTFEQNQFTVLVPIKQDSFLGIRYRYWRLRFALFFGSYLAGFGFPPGELTGVFTIHFLHWLVFDDGKTGMVFSNYDGFWENYLGDFADKLRYGLDALFNNCDDYPPGGLGRIEVWAEWVRSAQQVCPLYYSAYPAQTAVEITRDREIAALISKNFDEEMFLSLLRKLNN